MSAGDDRSISLPTTIKPSPTTALISFHSNGAANPIILPRRPSSTTPDDPSRPIPTRYNTIVRYSNAFAGALRHGREAMPREILADKNTRTRERREGLERDIRSTERGRSDGHLQKRQERRADEPETIRRRGFAEDPRSAWQCRGAIHFESSSSQPQ
ncbi:hypothetical protein C8J56DRAFT_517457 [Mycena floridula]|nr:hypothetical protein C8J56DRAFT_517457 [Mycena floridula]